MVKIGKRLMFMFKFWRFIPFMKDFFCSKDVELLRKIGYVCLIVAYVLFPFDIIPDFLLFFGILDDAMFAAFIISRMVCSAPESLKLKHNLH